MRRALVAGLLWATTARGQLMFEMLELNDSLLAALVGEQRAYTALVAIRAEHTGGMIEEVELRLMARAGRLRVELDLDRATLRHMDADAEQMFRRMGMAQVTEITRPAQGSSYALLPAAKAYCEVRPGELGRSPQPRLRVADKKATGQEEVDQHPCTVHKVTLTAADEDDLKLEATTWEAQDLQGFPIKIVVGAGQKRRVTIQFRELDLAAPDDWLFEPPSGWRQYPGVEPMMEDRLREAGEMFNH